MPALRYVAGPAELGRGRARQNARHRKTPVKQSRLNKSIRRNRYNKITHPNIRWGRIRFEDFIAHGQRIDDIKPPPFINPPQHTTKSRESQTRAAGRQSACAGPGGKERRAICRLQMARSIFIKYSDWNPNQPLGFLMAACAVHTLCI